MSIHVQKDVLASASPDAVFLDLHLDDLARVKDQLADIRALTGSKFAQNPLYRIDCAAREPVLPKQADLSPATEWWTIRSDQAKHSVKLPTSEQGDEEVVRGVEALVICSPPLLNCVPDHDRQAQYHNPACNTRASREVDFEKYRDL
jgi:hypothetical protein